MKRTNRERSMEKMVSKVLQCSMMEKITSDNKQTKERLIEAQTQSFHKVDVAAL